MIRFWCSVATGEYGTSHPYNLLYLSISSYTYISKNSGRLVSVYNIHRYIYIYIYVGIYNNTIYIVRGQTSRTVCRVCVLIYRRRSLPTSKEPTKFCPEIRWCLSEHVSRRSASAGYYMFKSSFRPIFSWTEKIEILYCLGTSHPTPSITHNASMARWVVYSYKIHNIYNIGR